MAANTLDDERTELWSSILDEMAAATADESRAEACCYLMQHLIDSAQPRSPRPWSFRGFA